MFAFRDAVLAAHGRQHVNLVFNTAGISGGGSFVTESRQEWERCFDVCWGGVYNSTRAFLPLLIAADDGHLINILEMLRRSRGIMRKPRERVINALCRERREWLSAIFGRCGGAVYDVIFCNARIGDIKFNAQS